MQMRWTSRLQKVHFETISNSEHFIDPPETFFSNLVSDDGHTLVDKTRHYKLCEPVKKLSKCRYFREPTWTLISNPESNSTEQIVHCHCPKNSITYLQNKQSYETSNGRIGYQYSFACSPQSVSVRFERRLKI
jgi:hypothetical protein